MNVRNTDQPDEPAGTQARRPARPLLWIGLTLVLLAGVCTDRVMFHTASADVGPYHARVREAAASVPLSIGTWSGADVPLPSAAVAMLNANVAVSRRYHNPVGGGRPVRFLLVHCSDARDVLGHYPPVCYAGAGWTLATAERRDWIVDGLVVRGTQYQFTSERLDRPELATISNFMVLPDGTTCRDMDEVTRNARDPRKKFFGAAQVQFVWDGPVSESECDDVVATFVRANRRVLDTIMSGVPNE